MSNTDKIIECLESISSEGCCDACLAKETGIRSGQQVSRICRKLAAEGKLIRKKAKCPLGDHTKIVNTFAARRAAGSRRSGSPTTTRRVAGKAPAAPTLLGIEEAWRYIDRFCRVLWDKHLETEPPSSLAEIITALRDEEILPVHEANMMHTIRSLRNLVVHENLDFGDHEITIARAAWQIVRAWAQQREGELWRLTMRLCSRRAA